MAQNKSWKELMALQGAAGGTSQQKANAMLDLIEGRQPFSYDPSTDPAAQAVRQETARNIARTTKDTLGGYAAMTGGMPSSVAVSAAAQAGNQAAVTGADRITELEQLARQNYMNEGSQMQSYWSMLQGQADSEYSRQQQEQQLAYQKEQDEYNRKYQLALLAAQYGDYSGLRELGVDTSKMSSGGYYYGSGGGSGGSGSGSGSTGGSGQPAGLDAAVTNDLRFQYGSALPGAVYDQLVAQYGEAAVTAAGFRRKAADPVGGSGKNQNDKPGAGNNRVNLAM